ncbi:tyrosine-type recombinase/integrase [Albimonas sp. CAU 1670]|uniref:tyrosine-type recombinase/integrase n=1 Tax=Albimonas sp. CAU 1670 TaxID=3032599 RepID=UPI0023D9E9D6|nr:tyrosine-type recombinase/integrase [Albimonas sp. CAU 1670]MDF2234549.1 tyrosine-type recombinase/integrase [Albimonas sp. CAU 1670]
MGLQIDLLHIRIERRSGHFVYRRRIPQTVRPILDGRREFTRVIGKTQAEALANYAEVHAFAESLIRGHRRLRALPDLRPCQAFAAVPLPLPQETSPRKPPAPSSPTLCEAFEFYLAERRKDDPTERHQQELAIARVRTIALKVLKEDRPLTEIKRQDARAIRDHMLGTGVKPITVKRRLSDLSAVFRLMALEHDLDPRSPFSGLSMPQDEEGLSRRQLRLPLPKEVIDAMYARLATARRPELLQVWTLLHHTGARLSEVAGLEASDLRLDDDVPHMVIEPKPWRRLKNAWSERRVPLLGDGLTLARTLPRTTRLLFPRYAEGRGPDSLSQALMKHLKEERKNNRQTVHSLRHSLKDTLRNTGAPHDLQNAILGHELSRGVDGAYGSGFTLEKLRDAPEPALSG